MILEKRHQREPHVIGDYCEYSSESPVSSQASDDELDAEEPVTISTVEIESHSFRETLSRSSSLDTLADAETISVNEMYDDRDELDQQWKWNHVGDARDWLHVPIPQRH